MAKNPGTATAVNLMNDSDTLKGHDTCIHTINSVKITLTTAILAESSGDINDDVCFIGDCWLYVRTLNPIKSVNDRNVMCVGGRGGEGRGRCGYRRGWRWIWVIFCAIF